MSFSCLQYNACTFCRVYYKHGTTLHTKTTTFRKTKDNNISPLLLKKQPIPICSDGFRNNWYSSLTLYLNYYRLIQISIQFSLYLFCVTWSIYKNEQRFLFILCQNFKRIKKIINCVCVSLKYYYAAIVWFI